jgi:hypothetical protein
VQDSSLNWARVYSGGDDDDDDDDRTDDAAQVRTSCNACDLHAWVNGVKSRLKY